MERGKIAGLSITIESNPRDPDSLGLSLDAVGIGLFMIGLSLVVLAP